MPYVSGSSVKISLSNCLKSIQAGGLIALASSCTITVQESAVSPTTIVESTVTNVESTTSSLPASTTSVESETTDTAGESNLFGGNDPEDMLMPDVRCMNLQAAQDEIQDHGVFFSRSEDATGQGRMQIIDSGWIVVKQNPLPGQPIGEFDPVLSVVKIGEPTGGVC